MMKASSNNNSSSENILPGFLQNKIACRTHKNQTAASVCLDCQTYCCMLENCGQPHIYHSIENLDYLLNSHIMPTMNNLAEINKEYQVSYRNYSSRIHEFKNNLKTFAIEEKKKIDDEYRKTLTQIQAIYNNYMNDITDFLSSVNDKFEQMQSKIESIYKTKKDASVSEINSQINAILNSCQNSNEIFVGRIAKDIKKINHILKPIHQNLSKFDFDRDLNEIKAFAEKEYPTIQQLGVAYFESLNCKLSSDIKKNEERVSLSQLSRLGSKKNSFTGTVTEATKVDLDIDLDIFVRNLYDVINQIRKEPGEMIKQIDEYIYSIVGEEDKDDQNFNDPIKLLSNPDLNLSSKVISKIKYLYEYFLDKMRSQSPALALEWDNDLSNSAEDYLRLFSNKIEKDESSFKSHLKEILGNYYQNKDYIESLASIGYIGVPSMNKILMQMVLNEGNWRKTGGSAECLLFDSGLNIIGICGSLASTSPSMTNIPKINLILNMGFYNK